MSTNITIASLPRMTSSELSTLLLQQAGTTTNNNSSAPTALPKDAKQKSTPISSSSNDSTPIPIPILPPTHDSQSQSAEEGRETNKKSIAIIDVRDDDHIGGHIHSSIHMPSRSLDAHLPELVKTLGDKDIVVFHCALSQQRGPKAALAYMKERERLLKGGLLEEEEKKKEKEKEEKEEKGKDEEGDDRKGKQEVYVLDRGFVGWQEELVPPFSSSFLSFFLFIFSFCLIYRRVVWLGLVWFTGVEEDNTGMENDGVCVGQSKRRRKRRRRKKRRTRRANAKIKRIRKDELDALAKRVYLRIIK